MPARKPFDSTAATTQAQLIADKKTGEPRIEYRTQYVEVPVSNSADQRAWQIAKRKVLDTNPNKLWKPVEFFRLVEEIKDLVLSGDPHGNIN